MSANHFVAESKFVFFISQLLNISIEDEIMVTDIENTLREIVDIPAFIEFVKERFDYSAYEFKTGYQKFVALARDFKKEHKPKLDDETEMKVYNYKSILKSKLTTIAQKIYEAIQTKCNKDTKVGISQTFIKCLKDKDIETCKMIGDFKTIYRLALNNIPKLEIELEKAITQKALITKYPQLANNKKEFEGMGTIERLKIGSEK